jgi:hypothetical protein
VIEPVGPHARLNEATAFNGLDRRPEKTRRASSGCQGEAKNMRAAYSGHWLDYDPIALVVLVVGIGAVALLAISI